MSKKKKIKTKILTTLAIKQVGIFLLKEFYENLSNLKRQNYNCAEEEKKDDLIDDNLKDEKIDLFSLKDIKNCMENVIELNYNQIYNLIQNVKNYR